MDDLKLLRSKGLTELRTLRLPWLSRAAAASGLSTSDEASPAAVETLVRTAVDGLGAGRLADAAEYTFGLLPGTRDWSARDRRRRSASIYGVSEDRFRKHYERIVLAQTAEAILRLCEQPPMAAGAVAPAAEDICSTERVTISIGWRKHDVAVHTCSVEMLTGIDIVVSTTNTHLEPAQTFKDSLSASLRRAAGRRSASGGIVDDVVATELADWSRRNGRNGLAVALGTVVPTASGELSKQGVTRIYHAAIASPRPGTNEYDVDPAVIGQAVRNVFQVARSERAGDPDHRSICLPLFGAGRGGLPEPVSFSWTWAAVAAELRHDPTWDIHFVARRASTARVILSGLRALDVGLP